MQIDKLKIPYWIKVYNRAGIFTSMSLFILQIILASQQDWVIVIYYNAYGEGMLELFLMVLLGLTLMYEASISILRFCTEQRNEETYRL